MNEHEDTTVSLARLEERVISVQGELHRLHGSFNEYVTKHEFWPTKVIALGLAGLLLSAVVAAIVAQVIK